MKEYDKVIVKETEREVEEFPLSKEADPYYEEMFYFLKCIKEGKPVGIDAEVGRLALQVCLSIQRSSQLGRVIRLQE